MNYREALDAYVVSTEIRKQRETIEGLLDEIEEKAGYLASEVGEDDHDLKVIVGAAEQIRELIETPR